MEKVLIYGKTIREARRFYPEKHNQAVGYRLNSEYGNGEEADLIMHVDGEPKPKEKSKKFKK